MSLFLQRSAISPARPGLIQCQVEDEEIEEPQRKRLSKLTMGQPGDVYEQEADRVVEVLRRQPGRQRPKQQRKEFSFGNQDRRKAWRGKRPRFA
jgi:hypothetical protein